jgi:nicotinate phosphoribosyltransferase
LDGVYKLVAVRENSNWVPALKLSENPDKVPQPGHKHVWRLYDQRGKATADLLSLDDEDPRGQEKITLHHPVEHHASRQLEGDSISKIEPLLEDVIVDGEVVYNWPSLEEIRATRDDDLEKLDSGVRRIVNPHIYHVSLTSKLWDLKQELIKSI